MSKVKGRVKKKEIKGKEKGNERTKKKEKKGEEEGIEWRKIRNGKTKMSEK